MNRGDIRTQVRDVVGETTADFWSDAELNRYIQEAHFRFLQEERWPWLVTEGTSQLTAGDGELELTEGVAASRHVNFTLTKSGDTKSYQPVRVDASKGFQLKSRFYQAGSYPGWFYITSVADSDDGGDYTWVARFVPEPSSDMDVDFQYTRTPVEFSGDNDTPDVPLEYHKALVHYAAGLAWLKELNGAAKAQEQFDLYAGVVAQARVEFQAEPDDTPLVMGKDEPQFSGRSAWGRVWDPQLPETLG